MDKSYGFIILKKRRSFLQKLNVENTPKLDIFKKFYFKSNLKYTFYIGQNNQFIKFLATIKKKFPYFELNRLKHILSYKFDN